MSESKMVMIGFGVVGVILALVLVFKSPEAGSGSGVDSRSLVIQGVNYLNGNGVAKDEPKGIELLKRAATLGHPEAQHRLGYLYTYGSEETEKDLEAGYNYYLQAAKQGVTDSMVNVGLALANGHGVTADIQDALKWWKKASNRGSPVATGNVGRCFEVGLGQETNLDKAMEYYKKGVVLEDGGSMYHLANMYFKG